MYYLFLSILIGGVIAFLVYQNIKEITNKLDTIEEHSPELYSRYASRISKIIKAIKGDIEYFTKENYYFLTKDANKDEVLEEFDRILRKLSHFDSISLRQKSKEEIEEELFKILISFDELVRKNFQNGENEADKIRELFFKEFERVKEEIIRGK